MMATVPTAANPVINFIAFMTDSPSFTEQTATAGARHALAHGALPVVTSVIPITVSSQNRLLNPAPGLVSLMRQPGMNCRLALYPNAAASWLVVPVATVRLT